MSDLRITQCREAARRILRRYHVESPAAIDLATLAWHVGRLKIRVGGLTGSEGRLVATKDGGGIIRVASNRNLGRFRFTVAHEIGHFELHDRPVMDHAVEKEHFGVWNSPTEEAEANNFAAELLLPDFLFAPRCVGVPSISLLDKLADEFQTSLIATSFQYWEYTREPVALVVSKGKTMTSFRPFKEGWPRIRFGEIHRDSAAGERLDGKASDSGRMVRSPAYAWLEGFERSDSDIMEDSIYLEYYDTTISLLWIDEPL